MNNKIIEWVEESTTVENLSNQINFRKATHIILQAISINEITSNSMIFKGGVLLGIKYLNRRFTTDLDFSCFEKLNPDNLEEFESSFNEHLDAASRDLMYGMKLKIQKIEIKPKKIDATFPALIINIAYLPYNSKESVIKKYEGGQCPHIISIDYSFNEVSHEVEELVIDGDNNQTLSCYTLEAIIAEKMRSILQQVERNRERGQDIFDIKYLLDETNEYLNTTNVKQKILELLIKKSSNKNIDLYLTVNGMDNSEIKERTKKGFEDLKMQNNLNNLIFNDYYNQVNDYFKSLPWPDNHQ